jgi:hypothetical protein
MVTNISAKCKGVRAERRNRALQRLRLWGGHPSPHELVRGCVPGSSGDEFNKVLLDETLYDALHFVLGADEAQVTPDPIRNAVVDLQVSKDHLLRGRERLMPQDHLDGSASLLDHRRFQLHLAHG